jgi:hypothetical protein
VLVSVVPNTGQEESHVKQYPYPEPSERRLLASLPLIKRPPLEQCFRLRPATRLPFDSLPKPVSS